MLGRAQCEGVPLGESETVMFCSGNDFRYKNESEVSSEITSARKLPPDST